jgi:hypothetical protein
LSAACLWIVILTRLQKKTVADAAMPEKYRPKLIGSYAADALPDQLPRRQQPGKFLLAPSASGRKIAELSHATVALPGSILMCPDK